MRTSFRAHVSAACLHLIALASASVAAGEPSASDLIGLAPVIRSSDEKCKSIEIGGYIKPNGFAHLTFRVIYRAPDKYALLINDGLDGTPLLFASDRRMFIYDPVQRVVLYSTDVNVDFSMRQEEDTLKFRCAAMECKDSKVLLDVKSFFSGPVKSDKVVKIGEREYRVTRTTEKGNSWVATIDPKELCPFSRIELIEHGNTNVIISINSICINGTLKDDQFAFPRKELLAEHIGVVDSPGEGSQKHLNGMPLMRACYVRAAATNPELREAIKLPGLSGIDWDRVKENDKKLSQVLRDFLAPGHKW